MAVLDPAAEALVKKLLEHRDAAGEAAEELVELREAIEGSEKELEDDWSSFTEAIESLLGVVGEHSGRLGPLGEEAGGDVEGLAGLTSQVRDAVASSLDGTEETLNALRDQVTGVDSEVERLVAGAVETPAEEVSDQLESVARGVEKTAEEGVASIREGFVSEAEQAVEMAGMLVDASVKILADNGTWVKQAVVAFTSKMGEVEDAVALEGFRKASAQAPQVIDYAVESLGTAQQDALEEARKLVSEARDELATLEEALRESTDALEGASGRLEEQVGGLGAALVAASEALQRVTEVLVSRGAM